MDNFKIINKTNKVEVDLNEYLFINMLKIIYVRDKKLYSILKKKYEQLTQKEFDDKLLNIKNM